MHNCPQCGWRFFTSEAIDCPRCKSAPRADRIRHEVARSKRLRDWVASCRIDGERGLGDTVLRLKPLAKSRGLKDDLRKLLRVCACHDDVAAEKLNEQYPY